LRTANTANYQEVFSAENGYELMFVDCDNDNAVQIEAVRTSIQQGVDYIILAPIETAGWESVLQEAKDAGIPVIVADRQVDADASMYDAFIGTDTVVEGEAAGNWLAEYLNGAEANILVIEGTVGSSAAIVVLKVSTTSLLNIQNGQSLILSLVTSHRQVVRKLWNPSSNLTLISM
jgi:simple sugar transport system substrate-binding protein